LREIRFAVHFVERLVETLARGNGQRLVGLWIERGAAIERIKKLAILIRQYDLCIASIPGKRRRDEGLAVFAKVAPVLFVDLVDDETVRKA
jgi:hypothetical protein